MLKNLKPKFIKSGSLNENLENWDRYLDKKYVYITEKIVFHGRFKNFFLPYINSVFLKSDIINNYENKVFELIFDFFDSPKLSFSNSEIDTLIKIKIKNFYEKLKQNSFILEIFCPESVGQIDHSFLSQSLINNENINNGKYFTNITIRCIMTKELTELRSETTNFVVKVILKEIKYKILNIKESEVNFGLLEFIQRIDLIPLLVPTIKNLNLYIEEFDIFSIINNDVMSIVEKNFIDAFNDKGNVSYFKFVMSSKPYIKYSVKFKVGDFYKDMD